MGLPVLAEIVSSDECDSDQVAHPVKKDDTANVNRPYFHLLTASLSDDPFVCKTPDASNPNEFQKTGAVRFGYLRANHSLVIYFLFPAVNFIDSVFGQNRIQRFAQQLGLACFAFHSQFG